MTIQTEFPLSLPQVTPDPDQLEMALVNLVVNARDAMAGEGTILISAEVGSKKPGDLGAREYVCLRVVDHGDAGT